MNRPYPESPPEETLTRLFAELGFVTCSAALAPLLRKAQKAAQVSDITLLIEGETGTGKQVLAQAIHRLDAKRKAHPFVTVHCGTIHESLAESELFGHQKGAFSGALLPRKGLFPAANQGTIFLDDVNDLPMSLQPKLLDVLQRNVIRAVGSDRESHVDVRVISASNMPLEPLVEQQRFRADLYHRLNVVKLVLPPLRERKEDLTALVLACAARHADLYPGIRSVDPELLRYLEQQPFRGNVRELEHALERALFSKVEGTVVELADWLGQAAEPPVPEENWAQAAADALWRAISERGIGYEEAIQQVERELLKLAVGRDGLTRQELAKHLRLSERTLYHKLRSHREPRAQVMSQSA
jgi:DNA-binding NtrC family response regulator